MEFLSLRAEPVYIGSSSGFSLAVNLAEMVQATVWNKVLPTSTDNGSAMGRSGGDAGNGESVGQDCAVPPEDEVGKRMLAAYFSKLHPRFPFLERCEVERLHEEQVGLQDGDGETAKEGEESTQEKQFGLFKIYMVWFTLLFFPSLIP